MKNFDDKTYASAAHERFAKKDKDEPLAEYIQNSMVIVTPTLGTVHWRVVQAWELMRFPMNTAKSRLWIEGAEVGKAYEMFVDEIEANPYLRDRMFLLTLEDDNIVPRDGITKLLEGIYKCIDCGKRVMNTGWTCPDGHKGLDGIAGVYFAKTEDDEIPLVFGDPKDPNDCNPLDIREAYENEEIIECNVIPNGCSLFRLKSVYDVPKPRFMTLNGAKGYAATQDVFFCKKAKLETGARFAAHCGVKIGHYDKVTGEIY